MATYQLHNTALSVEVSDLGAAIQSVRTPGGTEFIWEGDPAVWAGRAPILFPICGGLKNDTYFLGDQEYHQQKHGFIRFETFTPVLSEPDRLVLEARDNAETRKTFPFSFVFRVTFSLQENRLAVTYEVENTDPRTMYFSFGAHEGYATPEGVAAYEMHFEKEEKLSTVVLHGNLLSDTEREPVMEGKLLPLDPSYFTVDALVFETLSSRAVTLARRGGGRQVRVEFPGFDHLLLWQQYDAKYLCIEPWCGMPDFESADGHIEHKRYITALPAGETYVRTHTLTFSE